MTPQELIADREDKADAALRAYDSLRADYKLLRDAAIAVVWAYDGEKQEELQAKMSALDGVLVRT